MNEESMAKNIRVHISQRPLRGGTKIANMETQCGHVCLNVQCVSPEDYRQNRVPAAEVCASCRAELDSRERRETQA